ncbi:MAG TPA: hypothetical protein VNV38_10490 [Stellaceae bacterium]|jgi:hypothetical protein|nr:hypothetical protein [Stellaceae bacterium]
MASRGRGGIWRRLAVLTEIARRKVARRQDLRERAALWDATGPALTKIKTAPDLLKRLWSVAGAARELAGLGDSPELRRADADFIAQDPKLASREPYASGLTALVPRFRGRKPPAPNAPANEWYAWALAQAAG